MTADAVLPTGPLAGWTVLVPGTASGGPAAEVALAAAGAQALVVPLLVTVPPADPAPLDDALLALGAGWYARLVLTSAAAVPVLVDRAAHAGRTLAGVLADGGARVAAVGPGTARALRDAGVTVDLVPPAGSTSGAAALLTVWPDEPGEPGDAEQPAGRVLFARGDRALPTLPAGLRARGVEVDEVVAYRTVDAPDPDPATVLRWRSGGVDAVLLTSPTAVAAVVDRLGPPAYGTRVACIGATTAAAARARGLPVHAVADHPTVATLVAALAAHAAATAPTSPSPTQEPS